MASPIPVPGRRSTSVTPGKATGARVGRNGPGRAGQQNSVRVMSSTIVMTEPCEMRGAFSRGKAKPPIAVDLASRSGAIHQVTCPSGERRT